MLCVQWLSGRPFWISDNIQDFTDFMEKIIFCGQVRFEFTLNVGTDIVDEWFWAIIATNVTICYRSFDIRVVFVVSRWKLRYRAVLKEFDWLRYICTLFDWFRKEAIWVSRYRRFLTHTKTTPITHNAFTVTCLGFEWGNLLYPMSVHKADAISRTLANITRTAKVTRTLHLFSLVTLYGHGDIGHFVQLPSLLAIKARLTL